MRRWPQFTLRYLLALMFWWALTFAMFFEVERGIHPSHPLLQCNYILLFPIPLCSAIGSLVAKMRLGFVAGSLASGVMLILLIWHDLTS
jgi:hypothetical protein